MTLDPLEGEGRAREENRELSPTKPRRSRVCAARAGSVLMNALHAEHSPRESHAAGGGSIARFDRMYKTVEIGPQSAGSDPGPACYDRCGLMPTVTDADLLLGYFDAKNYANGRI